MMFHGMGIVPTTTSDDPFAGTDALGGPTNTMTSSEPDCVPGTPDCVPHWYCYIPFMATPDCLASFQEGTKELVSVGTSAAAGTVAAAASGVTSGVADGIAKAATGNGNSGSGLPITAGLLLALVGGLLVLTLAKK